MRGLVDRWETCFSFFVLKFFLFCRAVGLFSVKMVCFGVVVVLPRIDI